MKPPQEIEIKLRVHDLPALRRHLRAMQARAGKRVHEVNFVFDTANAHFRRSDQLVRLRLNDGRGVLTFKSRSLPSPTTRAAKYKVRTEIEFAVSDPRAAIAFLRVLGLSESFRYEKFRTTITLPGAQGAHVCLDETAIGPFLEIEGPPRAIDAAARRLGFRPRDYLTQSYLALWAAHCRAKKLPVTNFLFRPQENRTRPQFSVDKLLHSA